MIPVLAAAMDVRQVLEEKAGAIEQERPGTVVLRGQGIDAGLHIGEIPPEQRGHIGVEPAASRHRGIGASRQARGPIAPLAHRRRQSPHHQPVAHVPGDARQLRCAVGNTGGEASNRISHGANQQGAVG